LIAIVGCRNEQNLGKIEWNAQVVIDERMVLRRVEHFQQCRRRIAL
jgi:hypothetical protein